MTVQDRAGALPAGPAADPRRLPDEQRVVDALGDLEPVGEADDRRRLRRA